jgi:hypothetical protein
MKSISSHPVKSCLLTPFALLIVGTQSFASELVYQPQNSAFGGTAAATQILLSKAGSQNTTKEEKEEKSTLEKFQAQLESSILRSITRKITGSFDDESEDLTGQILASEDFSVTVLTDNDESIVIELHDLTDGTITTLTIPKI